MNRQFILYYLTFFMLLGIVGCKQAKYVQEGEYLLKKNKIEFIVENNGQEELVGDHPQISAAEMQELIRPIPNRSLKLFFYNRIDTSKRKKQILKKEEKYRVKNEKRKTRENKINNERIVKAEANGDSLYRHKVIQEKLVRLGWRNWVVENMGQVPVLLDTVRVLKSKKQLEIYLTKKGFYYGTVKDSIVYNNKKAEVVFTIKSGNPYLIRKVILDSLSVTNLLRQEYEKLLKNKGVAIIEGSTLDQDALDKERDRYSKFCRNNGGMYGFNKNYISYAVDTTVGNMQADVMLYIKPRIINDPNDPEGIKKKEIIHMSYRIRDVVFRLHNPDEESFSDFEIFKQKCNRLIAINKLDSLTNDYTYAKGDHKGTYPLLDTIKIPQKGNFYYNEKPFVDPHLLDKQNFLEVDMSHIGGEEHYYKDYYVERSYNTLSNLGIFVNISPKIVPETPESRWVIVTYDLVPVKKQGFLLEPRVLNTNGILGVEGGISYTNKNLWGGKAQQLQISLAGGVESQPLILGTDQSGESQRLLALNTFEWSPKISLTFPKIIPIAKAWEDSLSKRAYPKTIFDLTFNFQKRAEFSRNLVEFGYSLAYKSGKTQSWSLKLIEVNFVNLTKKDFFQEKLNLLNDPFLLNSYEDHLTLITSLGWHYNNINSNTRKKKHLHDLNLSVGVSGQLLTPVVYLGLNELGSNLVSQNASNQRQFFNVPYTQFMKFDGQYITSIYLNKKNSLATRAIVGVGKAYGNSPSLPYEQAYFAGGSNDIRAFSAREMAPGSYKTYADSNSTQTQIGDLKLEANFEWRFEMTSLLEGALFIDAGNIWNIRKDTVSATDPSVFKPSFYKEIAVGVGFGIRADFDFLIVRLDLAFALHNPHLPVGERWWTGPKDNYKDYFRNPGSDELIDYEKPHLVKINFGIGYPF